MATRSSEDARPPVLIGTDRIRRRVKRLGMTIAANFAGRPLTVVVISNGAMIFASDLIRAIDLPLQLDSISAHSYAGTESTGKVVVDAPLKLDVRNRCVLLVDDILDTGHTLSCLSERLRAAGPCELRTCVLLDKPERRRLPVIADYVGFTIPNVFVVGYGLDYEEYHRNLPYVGILG
jgi:hypoxanthine phosphoribosyltransferase